MRSLKLVIWDLDQTILTGILEEGDNEKDPHADALMQRLDERGILQALATQNPCEIVQPTLKQLGWTDVFVRIEADLRSKARKIEHILTTLDVDAQDAVFVDEDPFERDSIAVQIAGITSWSIADLVAYLNRASVKVTEEARRRSLMYRHQQSRDSDEKKAEDYIEFLRSCQIQITVRPYQLTDAERAKELLTRTHRMNLGILPIEDAVGCLGQSHGRDIIAELKDIYGDMGRCGIVHIAPDGENAALIESLAISCRTRARGLSLAMLVGLLRHPDGQFDQYRCRYVSNGSNRPLRMLLLEVGFKPRPHTNELMLSADRLLSIELPDWAHLHYLGVTGGRTR